MTEVVLQHVVFPSGIELPAPMPEVQSLYVLPAPILREVSDVSVGPEDLSDTMPPRASVGYTIVGRRSLSLDPHSTASFDSYFNRLHAGYLARWTALKQVTLRLRGSGSCRVTLRRSTAEGRVVIEDVEVVHLDPSVVWTHTLDLAPFAAGGAAWFDLESLDGQVELSGADWVAEVDEVHQATIDVAICTFNRPADVLTTLSTLRKDPEFLSHVRNVWLVDNGSKSFRDLPGADEVTREWGPALHHILQPNLGGSGGFSRGMHEAAQAGDSNYVFLMDDDVLAEPESLRRAVIFAELATTPIAVGGQMLNRQKPLRMESTGERVDSRKIIWKAAPLGKAEVRMDRYSQDRVVDVGYNAWWACLIPLDVVREIGLSMPMFIKWDDVEYGLRMAQHGVLTVTLPGVAVWHESWELKDAETDWTLYFFIRNRLIAWAILSADLPRSIRSSRLQTILREYFLRDVLRNVARRSLSSVHAVNMAIADFLLGPGILDTPLDELVTRVRAGRREYPGDHVEAPFTPTGRAPADPKRLPVPLRPLGMARSLSRELGISRPLVPLPVPPSLLKPKPVADEWEPWREAVDRGPVTLPDSADHWWALMDYADAIVVSVDGTKAVRRRREPRAAREVTRRFLALGRELLRRSDQLATDYAAARDHYISPEAWEKQWNR